MSDRSAAIVATRAKLNEVNEAHLRSAVEGRCVRCEAMFETEGDAEIMTHADGCSLLGDVDQLETLADSLGLDLEVRLALIGAASARPLAVAVRIVRPRAPRDPEVEAGP